MKTSDPCFLGIDTSCYTTSIALTTGSEVIYDKRIMLSVPKGSRGIRQSEAVFHHVKGLKQLFLDCAIRKFNIKAVGYSEKPCPTDASYMPVFCVGESYAIAIASALGVPSFAMTHQHGHIYAAFIGKTMGDGEYTVFHASGGTLDILKMQMVKRIQNIQRIGGTQDITCGQLIDRVGVAAGLPFPAGQAMERLYKSGGAKLAVGVKGLHTNLSGAETQALRMIEDGQDIADVCSGVIDCVGATLSQLIKNTEKNTSIKNFVFTGGVISNSIIRESVRKTCAESGLDCTIARREYSSDNACGLALGAKILYNKGEII